MITEKDLQEAIAECEGVRNPGANTCIKLAAFYILKDHLFPETKRPYPQEEYEQSRPVQRAYTAAGYGGPESVVDFDSGSRFSQAINGQKASDVWPVIDELMGTLEVINTRLYDGVMRKLQY